MFVRITKARGHEYLTIVENYRLNGKVKQRSIFSLGRVDKLKDNKQVDLLINALQKYSQKKTLIDISRTSDVKTQNWGVVKVFKKLWNMFELDKMFGEITKETKIQYDFFTCVLLMIIDRIIKPKSKLSCFNNQDNYLGINKIELHQLYRTLDVLAHNKDKIEQYLYNMNLDLFNIKVDIVFFDVTTLYFESTKSDELRKNGFSKDNKVNEVQVVFSLILSGDGRPVGFDVFPGNTFEGHTLKDAIDKLKKRFKINKIVFIGDRGILSKENLDYIRENKFEYIVGSRLKSKTKEIQSEIFRSDYIKVNDDISIKEIVLDEDRLICVRSEKRAEKDKADRERLLKRAKTIVDMGKSKTNISRGAYKYIDIRIENELKLKEDKIIEDEKWDGYYGIQTNASLLPKEALSRYHELWKIEEAFRSLKSNLEARPIFHWTPDRILGHLVLSFITFLLKRTLELELKNNDKECSEKKLREALSSLTVCELTVDGNKFYVREKLNSLAHDIFSVLKIKVPSLVSTEETFLEYIK